MNYFELYQIPVSFQPDLLAVKKRFYQLSREYHPDFFSNESAEEKDRVLGLSAMVNKAYQIFQDPSAIIKYILQLKGLLEEEEKYQLSPNFLIEVMDLNELLMDATDEQEKSQVSNSIQTLQSAIYEPIATVISNYEEGITTEKELLQVKEYYYQKKYLDRILAEY